jgi:hypothetical protein
MMMVGMVIMVDVADLAMPRIAWLGSAKFQYSARWNKLASCES